MCCKGGSIGSCAAPSGLGRVEGSFKGEGAGSGRSGPPNPVSGGIEHPCSSPNRSGYFEKCHENVKLLHTVSGGRTEEEGVPSQHVSRETRFSLSATRTREATRGRRPGPARMQCLSDPPPVQCQSRSPDTNLIIRQSSKYLSVSLSLISRTSETGQNSSLLIQGIFPSLILVFEMRVMTG